jgi:hypothetical protein
MECCGVGGIIYYSLPYAGQAFIQLKVDAQQGRAAMAIVRSDTETVFHTFPNTFEYNLTNGIVFGDYIQFGYAGPPPMPSPGQASVSLTVSNSVNGILINGQVLKEYMCCDIPNSFRHTNVVATLLKSTTRPRLWQPAVSTNAAITFRVMDGASGETNVIEASSDLINWTPISTNVFPPTACPICPFIDFQDTEARNFSPRYYRSFIVH